MEIAYQASVFVFSGLFRLIPKLPNWSPVYSAVSYGFSTVKNSIISTLIVILMLFLSDVLLSLVYGQTERPLYGTWMLYIYPIHVFNGFLSKFMIKRPNQYVNIGVCCTITSFSFHMLSNFGVFLEKADFTVKTLRQTYVESIPYFPITILSNILFSILFFGLHCILFGSKVREQTIVDERMEINAQYTSLISEITSTPQVEINRC